MEQLIGKVLAEPEFRQQLVSNPNEAIRSAGIQLSQQEMQAITSSSREEREQMMQQLGDRSSPALGTLICGCAFWTGWRF